MTQYVERNELIARVKAALKARSDRPWSVTGDRGTSYGWVTVTAPPRRRTEEGSTMTALDRMELCRLFNLTYVHDQGLMLHDENSRTLLEAVEAGLVPA